MGRHQKNLQDFIPPPDFLKIIGMVMNVDVQRLSVRWGWSLYNIGWGQWQPDRRRQQLWLDDMQMSPDGACPYQVPLVLNLQSYTFLYSMPPKKPWKGKAPAPKKTESPSPRGPIEVASTLSMLSPYLKAGPTDRQIDMGPQPTALIKCLRCYHAISNNHMVGTGMAAQGLGVA